MSSGETNITERKMFDPSLRICIIEVLRKCCANYKSNGTLARRRGNVCFRISTTVRNELISPFYHNRNVFIHVEATRTRVTLATVRDYLRKELKRFPYKLHMAHAFSKYNESNRTQFAGHCSRELKSNSVYLHRIIFSDECLLRWLEESIITKSGETRRVRRNPQQLRSGAQCPRMK